MKFTAHLLALACLISWPISLMASPADSTSADTAQTASPVFSTLPGQRANYSAAEISQFVDESISKLEKMKQEGRNFQVTDAAWIDKLNVMLGADSLENLPHSRKVDCRLSWDRLAKIEGSVSSLLNTLKTMRAATNIKYQTFRGPDYQVPVYNSAIFNLMRPEYTSTTLGTLRDLALRNYVFRINLNEKNGLISTSDIAEGENPEMSERAWITDTIYAGFLETNVSPKAWTTSLNTLAKFYTGKAEQRAFDKAIADPSSYREGGPVEGVAHIFYPSTLERDSQWFNNKRLESHGLALRAFMAALRDGCIKHWDRGIKDPSPQFLQAVTNLTAYLVSIDYATAPSAGNWEEIPFPGGLTWDTQAINDAMGEVIDIMYNPAFDSNKDIVKLRKALRCQKHGDIFSRRQDIEKAYKRGLDRVQKTYYAESPGQREKDISLALLSSTQVMLDNDLLKSVRKHLKNLKMLEDALVRDNGVLRYAPFDMTLKDGSKAVSPDSYLNLNYNIACDPEGHVNFEWLNVLKEFGSKDASEADVFMARSLLTTPNCEAQWFLVSDLARGYAEQAKAICDKASSRTKPNAKPTLTDEEEALIKECLAGANRNINRAYARITPETDTVKANGAVAPAWSVPEAWQCVSTLPPNSGKAYLPGVNTPLTWAESSLWMATNHYISVLTCLEAMKGGRIHHGPSPNTPQTNMHEYLLIKKK
ncbi:MAG: hypothetical protein ACI38Q_07200 [Candidatus Bruticola sp.]